MRRAAALALGLFTLVWATMAGAAPGPAGGGLARWAVVIVAGDDHAAHTEALTETFDNARRDIAVALERKGFARANMAQFSVRPERYPAAHAGKADLGPVFDRLTALAARAPAGCLLYFTSHGAPGGLVLDDDLVRPEVLGALLGRACGKRPTAVIISACFSGVFVPNLAAPNRMILTAARRDRPSFGCGESDTYPYFDACVLESLPGARDLIDLAPAVRRCVARREDEEALRPRSEPQLFVGEAFRVALPPFGRPVSWINPPGRGTRPEANSDPDMGL